MQKRGHGKNGEVLEENEKITKIAIAATVVGKSRKEAAEEYRWVEEERMRRDDWVLNSLE